MIWMQPHDEAISACHRAVQSADRQDLFLKTVGKGERVLVCSRNEQDPATVGSRPYLKSPRQTHNTDRVVRVTEAAQHVSIVRTPHQRALRSGAALHAVIGERRQIALVIGCVRLAAGPDHPTLRRKESYQGGSQR